MSRDLDELYLPKFTKEDEVTLVSSSCGKPWGCTCTPNDPGCGMTIQEAKDYIAGYYRAKADHCEMLSPEEFMAELGFYFYKK